MSRKAHNINELYSIVDDGYTSDQDVDTRQLISEVNRKKKKSGGFQSMGLLMFIECINVVAFLRK